MDRRSELGGICIMRVVHSLLASGEDWDDQLESIEPGWPAFFRILRLYLAHFRGATCSMFQWMCFAPEPVSQAWDALTGSFGLDGAIVGQRRNASAGVPLLAGVVEVASGGAQPYTLLLLDAPALGAVFLNACAMGGQVGMPVSFYLYGDRAAAAARIEPLWRAWMSAHFPPLSAAGD